jgi:hypothetical protein
MVAITFESILKLVENNEGSLTAAAQDLLLDVGGGMLRAEKFAVCGVWTRRQKSELVSLLILEMLDDAEKAGKEYLEGSIGKENTKVALHAISEMKDIAKNHLPSILDPLEPSLASRLLGYLSCCRAATGAIPPAVKKAVLSSVPPAQAAAVAKAEAFAAAAQAEVQEQLEAVAKQEQQRPPLPPSPKA